MFGMVNTKYKTMMCRHFEQTGNCQLGPKCHFAHGKEELRKITDPLPPTVALEPQKTPSMPQAQSFNASNNAVPSNYKTVKCKYFEQGYCKFNQSCSFAHGDQDIRTPQENATMPTTMPYQMPSIPQQTASPMNDQAAQNAVAQQQIQYLIQQMEQYHANTPQFLYTIKSAKELNSVGNMPAAATTIYEIIQRQDKSKEDNEKYNEFLANIQNLGQVLYQNMSMQYMHGMNQMYQPTMPTMAPEYGAYTDASQYKQQGPYYGMMQGGYGYPGMGSQGMTPMGGMSMGMMPSAGGSAGGQGKGSIGKS
jgi:hypothetical protein